jgi:glutaredoxin
LTLIKFHFCILFSFEKDKDTLGCFMKGLMICGLWLSVLFSSFAYSQQTDVDAHQDFSCTSIEVFSRQGCPHCKAAYQALENLTSLHPKLTVSKRDIQQTAANFARFLSLNETHKKDKPGVPSFYMCDHFWIAFDHFNEPLEVRQSHSNEEAPEQTELALKAEGEERMRLTKRKHFQWILTVTQSMDNLFSNLERLGEVVKQYKFYSMLSPLTQCRDVCRASIRFVFTE